MTTIVQRARPSLGTLVDMRLEGLDESRAAAAIDAAFAEINAVHRCMSFHETGSDLSRLHRAPAGTPVRVDARTCEVLACALRIAAASAGVFDPTIAAQQRLLPRPESPFQPDPGATWRDIELLDVDHVRLRRPLWIDLGGIAKGYAVDRAVEILIAAGATQGCVNAGGDLRLFGSRVEAVHLRTAHGFVAGIELADAALATSVASGAHLDGRTRRAARGGASVSVIAERCVIADALTKVVLAVAAEACRELLTRFGARACRHDPAQGWQLLDAAA